MNKYFSQQFWKLFKLTIKRSEIIAIILSAAISFLLFALIEKNKQGIFWGISVDSWRAVASSIFAASLFLFIQWIIAQLKHTEDNFYKIQYVNLIENNGIKSIYYQRGGENIIALYKQLIANSKRRIWAIGMTNNHFCDQHFDNILDRMEKRRGDFGSGNPIDFVVSFWNPSISFFDDAKNQNLEKILEIQSFIEKGSFPHSNWQKIVESKKNELIKKIETRRNLKGNFKITYTTLPTNFTCFVIDDDVFFFPYLSGPDSTNNPTIHCDSLKGIGISITNHLEKLLKTSEVVDTVYQNSK